MHPADPTTSENRHSQHRCGFLVAATSTAMLQYMLQNEEFVNDICEPTTAIAQVSKTSFWTVGFPSCPSTCTNALAPLKRFGRSGTGRTLVRGSIV
jgi:hypothetical protein